jgi:hypothetical protein
MKQGSVKRVKVERMHGYEKYTDNKKNREHGNCVHV